MPMLILHEGHYCGEIGINIGAKMKYHKISDMIRRAKSQNLQESRLVLQLSFPNPLKPDVKSRMKV